MPSSKIYATTLKISLGKKNPKPINRDEQQAQILITCRHSEIVSDTHVGEERLFMSPSCNYVKMGVETIDTWQMKPILQWALL